MKNSFYGWYLKCQSDTKTAAFIPAVHTMQEGKKCSIQIITDQDTWMVSFLIFMFFFVCVSLCTVNGSFFMIWRGICDRYF